MIAISFFIFLCMIATKATEKKNPKKIHVSKRRLAVSRRKENKSTSLEKALEKPKKGKQTSAKRSAKQQRWIPFLAIKYERFFVLLIQFQYLLLLLSHLTQATLVEFWSKFRFI